MGRRLAEHCLKQNREAAIRHGLDADVVEAACLGHDLGHPPFGHIGEQTLHRLLTVQGEDGGCLDPEGFEGNAQSFRVVTKLAVRFTDWGGLNLTRATLAALLKYPWKRHTDAGGNACGKDRKWGYYESEQEDFDFCREGLPAERRTLEAELMNWADDIAYSVHDLEDFHRCNYIPWPRIIGDAPPDLDKLIENSASQWQGRPGSATDRLREAHQRLSGLFGGFSSMFQAGTYEGKRSQRLEIRSLTSELIGRYVMAAKVAENGCSGDCELLSVDDEYRDEIRVLKQFTRDYILGSPALAAQQEGQKRVLERLFCDFLREITSRKPRALPPRFHHFLEFLDDDNARPARVAADCVASMTEGEAIRLDHRLTGLHSGSVLDPIVR